MVDHDILLQRLETSCGIRGNPFLWLESYLSGRTQMVICGDTRIPWVLVKYGVPQGSVLGPLHKLEKIRLKNVSPFAGGGGQSPWQNWMGGHGRIGPLDPPLSVSNINIGT